MKSGLFQARTPFLGGRQGVSPGRLIHYCGSGNSKLILFKMPLLGEAYTAIRLGIKSRFGVMGFFSTSDAILGLCSYL